MTAESLGLPESTTRLVFSEGFALHAAPQAIEYHLKTVRRRLAAHERAVARYEALLAHRLAQVEAGTWPPAPVEDIDHPPADKVVDLMAALEESLAKAKEARKHYRRPAPEGETP